MTSPLDREDLRARVGAAVDAEVSTQRGVLAEVGEDVALLVDQVGALMSGGKRLRSAFLYWGYRCSGLPGNDQVVRLATAMEFFQAAALLHDDVMDRSDVRRGRPTAHRALARHHGHKSWQGDAALFGESGAILAGDLCLGWTDELVATCGLPAQDLARARSEYDRMRTLLMGGQFLDVLESVRDWADLTTPQRVASARHVIRYKSAKYSIEQPLLIGMRAGGVADAALPNASRYGLALGEAFQLRDDLLGVYGDPAQTGKPAGDDLREGKRTVLIAEALDGDDPVMIATVRQHLGNADLDDAGVAVMRELLVSCGAVERVEARIAEGAATARQALAGMPSIDADARTALDELIELTTARNA